MFKTYTDRTVIVMLYSVIKAQAFDTPSIERLQCVYLFACLFPSYALSASVLTFYFSLFYIYIYIFGARGDNVSIYISADLHTTISRVYSEWCNKEKTSSKCIPLCISLPSWSRAERQASVTQITAL